MVISLVVIFVTIPGLFKEFTRVICDHDDQSFPIMKELMSRAKELQISLQNWYSNHIRPSGILSDRPTYGTVHYDALIIFYICMIYSNRLSTCIYWQGTPNIKEMEEDSQRFARIIVSLNRREESYSNYQGSLLLAQKLPIAEATLESGETWARQLSLGHSEGQLFKIPAEIFAYWCRLFGRRTS
jgi:hypothetical protein